MKKFMICSALAIGLLVFGTSQNNAEAAQHEAIISSIDMNTFSLDETDWWNLDETRGYSVITCFDYS